MKVNQIYQLLNTVQKEAFGEETIVVHDTTGLVSLGEYVFNNDEKTLDMFYKSLIDRIGKTYIKYREYVSDRFRGIERSPLDFGAVLQKVQIHKIAKAKENNSWKDQNGMVGSPKDETDFTSQLFSAYSSWEVEKVIYDHQLKTAFTDEKSMGAFVNMVFQDMYNAMEVQLENTSNLAVSTAIASCFKTTSTNRNLLKEYNDKHVGNTLTVSNCMESVDFLKFATMEIRKATKRMEKMSSLFNSAGADRFTPSADLRVDILSDFSSATATYLEADTYHKELVALPMYKEVMCWLGCKNYSFDETSAIKITDESGTTTEKAGIIAFIYDKDKVATTVEYFRTKSQYNARHELTNYWHKADVGYFVDESENGIVFYIADEV